MERGGDEEGEREFVMRVLSVLTGRLPVPEQVGRRTTAQLEQDRKQRREEDEARGDRGNNNNEDEDEEEEGQLYITDRSLCGSARQRELVAQYLQWVLRSELGLPASAVERQSWTKSFTDGSSVRLTNVVVSFAGDSAAAADAGDIVVGAHHDVQNNQSHCWMPSEETRASAKDLRRDAHHHHNHEHEEGHNEEEEQEEDEYVVTAGADDNGSGVVGCLALVRRMVRQTQDGWQPRHTIRVALFDGEEPGSRCSFTEGSAEFYRRCTIKGAKRFAFSFSLALLVGLLAGELRWRADPTDARCTGQSTSRW
jgi:hypothetical protein